MLRTPLRRSPAVQGVASVSRLMSAFDPLRTLARARYAGPMSVVPPSVWPLLQRAGWFEGRCVAVDATVPPQHPSYAVLAELGGIVLRDPAPNVGSIAFRHV